MAAKKPAKRGAKPPSKQEIAAAASILSRVGAAARVKKSPGTLRKAQSRGGSTTLERHGRDFYRKISKLSRTKGNGNGTEARAKAVETTRKRYGADFFRRVGRGESPSKDAA